MAKTKAKPTPHREVWWAVRMHGTKMFERDSEGELVLYKRKDKAGEYNPCSELVHVEVRTI